MQQQNIPIATLVDMHKGCELHLPEIPRHCVWQNTRMRDLLDSLYRGYPSDSIPLRETDEAASKRDFAIARDSNAADGRKLLLEGKQRLTFLTAALNGEPESVRGRKHPIDIVESVIRGFTAARQAGIRVHHCPPSEPLRSECLG